MGPQIGNKSSRVSPGIQNNHKGKKSYFFSLNSRWADQMTALQSHDDTTQRSRCFYDYDQYVGQNVAKTFGAAAAVASVDDMALIQSGTQGWYDEASFNVFQPFGLGVMICRFYY